MSDFDKLKKMDIEDIYRRTYIARKYIKALLDKDFSKFDRLKALGFVKIIEREFEFDLSDLKNEIDEYFVKDSIKLQESSEDKKDISNIADNKEEKNNKAFFITVVIIVSIIVAFYIYNSLDNKEKVQKNIPKTSFFERNESNNSKNENLEENIKLKENNDTVQDVALKKTKETKKIVEETKSSETKAVEETKSSEKKAVLPSIVIIPKQRVWIGMIYLDDYSKENYVTSSPIDINTSRDQLIVTGHGNIKIEIDGNVTDYKETKKLRFLYRAGDLEKIDKETFKKFNRGKNW